MTSLVYSGYTYEGQVSNDWYTKFFIGAPSVTRLKLMPNIKSKRNMPNLGVGDLSTADSCTFSANGDITISTRQIEVTTLKIQAEWCEEDLETLFLANDMRPGSNNAGDFTPAGLRSRIMELVATKASEEIELMIWQGDTGGSVGNYLDEIDGLEVKMAADGSVVSVVGTTLTVANILTEVDKVIAAVPKVMLKRKKLASVGIGMGLATYELFIQGLRAAGYFNTLSVETPDEIMYNGYRFFTFDGMSDDTMVFADFDRIWVGTDLASDFTSLRIIPMNEHNGDDMVRVKGRYKLGVEYAVSEEIVFYQA